MMWSWSELRAATDVSGRFTSHSRDASEFDAKFGVGTRIKRCPRVAESVSSLVRLGGTEAPSLEEEGDLTVLRSLRGIGPDCCHRIQMIAAFQADAHLGSHEVVRTGAGVSRCRGCGRNGEKRGNDEERNNAFCQNKFRDLHAWSTSSNCKGIASILLITQLAEPGADYAVKALHKSSQT